METYAIILLALALIGIVFRASQTAFYYLFVGMLVVGAYYMYSHYGLQESVDIIMKYVNVLVEILR